MGNYDELKQAVSDVIKTNGNQEITGKIMQNTLLSIINIVGENATFAGIATPETNPGTPDQNVFYMATEDGTYSNFNATLVKDNVVIFSNVSGAWSVYELNIATKNQVETLSKIQYVSLGYGYNNNELKKNNILIKTTLGGVITEQSLNNWGSLKIQCSAGDLFYISCFGGQTGFAYAFVDNSNTVIECANRLEFVQRVIKAPLNAVNLVVNNAFGSIYNEYPVVMKLGYKTVNNGFINLSWFGVTTENVNVGEIGYNSTTKLLRIKVSDGGYQTVQFEKNVLYYYYGSVYKEVNGELVSIDVLDLKQYTFKSPAVVDDLEIGDLLYSAYRSLLYRKESNIQVTVIPFSPNVIYKYENTYLKWDSVTNRLIPYTYSGNTYLKKFTDSFTGDGLVFGDICYNTGSKKLRMYVGDSSIVGGNGFDDIPFVDGGLYVYNSKIYYYDGNNLVETANSVIPNVVLLKKFAVQFTEDYLQIGDICFNANTKLLRRFVGKDVTLNGFETVPFTDGTRYLYNGQYYYYNGDTLVQCSIDGNFRQLTKKCAFMYPHKKILLSGASIACDQNGFFEYACKKLDLQGTNVSIPSVNAMWLANELFSNGSAYNEHDVLLLSHTHNYDVFTLPNIAANWNVDDYETYVIPYTGNSTVSSQPTYGFLADTEYNIDGEQITFTANELYAMAFDYIIKKWSKLCYSLKGTPGYDAKHGKPIQIALFTFWHDARPTYNMTIRQLSVKWNIPLIADDEQIGFTKDIKNPETNNSYSLLYISDEWADTYTLVEYPRQNFATHPYKVKDTQYWSQWQSGDIQLEYLPYIQQKRAQILISTIKSDL